ncbi:MAG: hypothetical protein ACK4NR_06845 [Micavibrio sp.]
MDIKQILSVIGMCLAVYCLFPYYIAILKRKAKPHIFTWVIFGIITSLAAAIQFSEGGGSGAWIVGLNGALCLTVVVLSLKFGEKQITKGDWLVFVVALSAVPVWLLANNPLWAVLILLMIEIFAYYPTLRKSWLRPHEEVIQTWLLGAITFLLSVLALEEYSFTTAAYPAFVSSINFMLAGLLLYRRRALAKASL